MENWFFVQIKASGLSWRGGQKLDQNKREFKILFFQKLRSYLGWGVFKSDIPMAVQQSVETEVVDHSPKWLQYTGTSRSSLNVSLWTWNLSALSAQTRLFYCNNCKTTSNYDNNNSNACVGVIWLYPMAFVRQVIVSIKSLYTFQISLLLKDANDQFFPFFFFSVLVITASMKTKQKALIISILLCFFSTFTVVLLWVLWVIFLARYTISINQYEVDSVQITHRIS